MRKRLGALGAMVAGIAMLAGVASAASDVQRRVDVNSASAAELAQLPGIGPSKAQAIVDHRAKEPFKTPDDLRKVKGIGDRLLESLRDQITVGEASTGSGRGS